MNENALKKFKLFCLDFGSYAKGGNGKPVSI